jgi:creatinine amidohydrolase/Fe(II)-dependent formamide hydrolase-like protein
VLSLFDCAPSAQQPYTRDGLDIHANQAGASILMHLRPRWSVPQRLVGHARRASAEDGHVLVELLVGELSAIVAKALVEEWPAPTGPS